MANNRTSRFCMDISRTCWRICDRNIRTLLPVLSHVIVYTYDHVAMISTLGFEWGKAWGNSLTSPRRLPYRLLPPRVDSAYPIFYLFILVVPATRLLRHDGILDIMRSQDTCLCYSILRSRYSWSILLSFYRRRISSHREAVWILFCFTTPLNIMIINI